MRLGGSTIHPALLTPLLVMALAYTSLFLWLHIKAMRAEILRRRVDAMTMLRVSQAAELKAAE
jgi:heme exporter protein C